MNTSALIVFATASMIASLAIARLWGRVWLFCVLASTTAALVASFGVLLTREGWDLRSTLAIGGEPVHVRLDALAAFFLALLSVVGGAAAAYARTYWDEASHPETARAGRAWWSGLLLCLGFVLLSSNGLHFLVAWEAFTVCAYFLITLDAQRTETRAAGYLYLGASHAGMLLLFAFFALLAVHDGSWDLDPAGGRVKEASLFWLALLGFGIKAGMFPLHVWLPSAHANAPSHVSAIMSGVTLKLGIYGLVRTTQWVEVPPAGGWVVVALGILSAVLGVAFALGQHDLKRLLAYHSVENIGIILIGIGFSIVAADLGHPAWGTLALAGGLLHVWNHGLFKSLLFLGAGSVLHATGTREMSLLGGLHRRMPWTAILFGLGAAAISGLPPLNGFVSEWFIYLALFDAADASAMAVAAALLLAMTGALALACFVKVCGVVFLGAPRSPQALRAHEADPWMRAPMIVLGAACVLIGVAPRAVWSVLEPAVHALQGEKPATLVPVVALGRAQLVLWIFAAAAAIVLFAKLRPSPAHRPTWDCGYAAPTSRMQYTAGSFAAIITGWFSWILLPVRHARGPEGSFPREAALEQHTPETILERVIEPVAGGVMWISGHARRLQHGRAQVYVLYLTLGILAIALVALGWDGRVPQR